MRSVDELVYLALIAYPHYADLESGEFVSVEQVIERLSIRDSRQQYIPDGSWLRKIENIAGAMTYKV